MYVLIGSVVLHAMWKNILSEKIICACIISLLRQNLSKIGVKSRLEPLKLLHYYIRENDHACRALSEILPTVHVHEVYRPAVLHNTALCSKCRSWTSGTIYSYIHATYIHVRVTRLVKAQKQQWAYPHCIALLYTWKRPRLQSTIRNLTYCTCTWSVPACCMYSTTRHCAPNVGHGLLALYIHIFMRPIYMYG